VFAFILPLSSADFYFIAISQNVYYALGRRHCGLDPQSCAATGFEIAGQARNDNFMGICYPKLL